MENIIVGLYITFVSFFSLVVGVELATRTGMYHDNTIYSGKPFEVESKKIYYCKPTERTKEYLKLEKQINEFDNPKKEKK